MAAVSYDSEAILKNFAERRKIRYPLLSDADSKTIREFGILNESVPKTHAFHGIPHPVTFVTDHGGVVKSKYFEEDYKERQTLAGLLAKDYGIAPGSAKGTPQAKHVKITTTASTEKISHGQRILLAVEIEMAKGLHLYAPGVEGYIATEWKMPETPLAKAHEVVYPKSRVLYLEAIKEKVPVFEGKIRLLRDVTMGPDKALRGAMGEGNKVIIEAGLRYQACNDRLCYPPETVPLKWELELTRMDSERVPAGLRKQ